MSNAIDEIATLTADLRAWIEWQHCLGTSALPRESVPKLDPVPVPRGNGPQKRTPTFAVPRPQRKPSQPQTVGNTTTNAPDSKPRTGRNSMPKKWKALMDAPTTHRVSGPSSAPIMIVRGSGSTAEAEAMLDRMLKNVLGAERTSVCVVDLHRDTRSPGTIGEGFRRALPELNPGLIIVMGQFAVQALFGEEATLDGLRGKWLHLEHEGASTALRVTHHPEAILLLAARGQTETKREAFVDLKAVGQRIT